MWALYIKSFFLNMNYVDLMETVDLGYFKVNVTKIYTNINYITIYKLEYSQS